MSVRRELLCRWCVSRSGPTPCRATRGWQRGQLLVPLAVGLGAAALASLVAIVDSRSELTGSWLIVVATIGAIGLLTGFATRSHMQARAEAAARRQHEISRHLDVLDGVVTVGAPLSEPASAEMLARIDASVHHAELLRAVAEGVHGIEALFDLAGRLIWISPSIERVTGRTPAQCMNADDALALLVHESDLGYCRSMAQKVAQGGAEGEFEIRLVGENGQVRWIACCWRRIETDGAPSGLCMSAEDVQARKEKEYKLLETVAELRRSQALREHYLARSNDERRRLIALLNAIRLGILFMDRDRRVLYYNRAMLDIWGFPPDENLIGVRDVVLQNRVAHLVEDPEAYLSSIQEPGDGKRFATPREIHFKDGRIVTDASAVVESESEGGDIGRVWIYEDVTEQRRIAERLVQMAERDPLTDLFNRRRFHEELDRLLADAIRRNYGVGLIIFDLDGFKPINDEFGHQAGDEVLVTMSRHVGSIIRRNETFFRLGGDEFAVLVPDADVAGLDELARRIVEGVAALKFVFEGRETGLTASLGIAMFPTHAEDGERLVAAADHAMYRSKSTGRNRWSIAGCDEADSARIEPSGPDGPNRQED